MAVDGVGGNGCRCLPRVCEVADDAHEDACADIDQPIRKVVVGIVQVGIVLACAQKNMADDETVRNLPKSSEARIGKPSDPWEIISAVSARRIWSTASGAFSQCRKISS